MTLPDHGTWTTMPIDSVPGIGPRTVSALSAMGIDTVDALLRHYPHRYLDLQTQKQLSRIKEGDEVTVVGTVKDTQTRLARSGRTNILTVTIFDGTGYLDAVWFNQNYIAGRVLPGKTVAFSGKANWRAGRLQMNGPLYDVLEEGAQAHNTGRIIPMHPATAQVSAVRIRKLIKEALNRFASDAPETLPDSLLAKYRMPGLVEALWSIHFPSDRESLRGARKRLIFEELFYLQLGLASRKYWASGSVKGMSHVGKGELAGRFVSGLPWELTEDQGTAISEITADLQGERPMHRLLLGEVGSGKTVVAAAAMLTVVECDRQAVLMAPTEVLAEQHFFKLAGPLAELGLRVELLTGGRKAGEKRTAVAAASGVADVVIGTHSLIQDGVDFGRLGLVVIDEQHKFGVNQRLKLRGKGENPDLLVMTATPIPRTMALTLYGDLDVSVLKGRPGGRALGDQIKTVHLSEARRERAYELIRREARAGRRSYIICPLVDESDKLEAKAVLGEAERLREEIFPDLSVGILHGRLHRTEKEKVMSDFRDGGIDVLISTTVVEVGIDVPEATVIVIEHAERFGLSQLHQLRGRVGRGEAQSYCVLFGDLKTPDSRARIDAVVRVSDGFELAEADLEIRGEGQLFGERQSGLPDLKLAQLTKHMSALRAARKEAFTIIATDPELLRPEHDRLREEMGHRFADSLEWLRGG